MPYGLCAPSLVHPGCDASHPAAPASVQATCQRTLKKGIRNVVGRMQQLLHQPKRLPCFMSILLAAWQVLFRLLACVGLDQVCYCFWSNSYQFMQRDMQPSAGAVAWMSSNTDAAWSISIEALQNSSLASSKHRTAGLCSAYWHTAARTLDKASVQEQNRKSSCRVAPAKNRSRGFFAASSSTFDPT